MPDLVPVTVLVVVGTTEARRISEGNGPTMKPVIAGFIVGIGLYGLAALDDTLGHYFSLLIIVSAIVVNGLPIFTKITGGKTK